MPSEAQRKAAMQAYIDRFNAADLEGLLALYAEEAVVEDPVGSEPCVGKAAIADFYRHALATGSTLTLEAPIRAAQGEAAAMAFRVELCHEGQASRIRVIDVMTFNARGEFTRMSAYWGASDVVPA